MDFHAKIYLCYFDDNFFVSYIKKKETNLRMETTILEMFGDIESRQSYLPHFWYMLKYFVKVLHVVYKLLYNVLIVYGNSSMRTKLRCHNLIDGPWSIQNNMQLFRELVRFTQIQTQLVSSLVRFNLNPKFQDAISRLFFRLTKFLNMIIWYNNSTSSDMCNGLPVKMNFL